MTLRAMCGAWVFSSSRCWRGRHPSRPGPRTRRRTSCRGSGRGNTTWTQATGPQCPASPRTSWPRCWTSTHHEDWPLARYWLTPGWHPGINPPPTFSDRILNTSRYSCLFIFMKVHHDIMTCFCSRPQWAQHSKLCGIRVLWRQLLETLDSQNLPEGGGDPSQRTRGPHQPQYSKRGWPKWLAWRKGDSCLNSYNINTYHDTSLRRPFGVNELIEY